MSTTREYYHIVTRDKYEVGQKLVFSETTNNRLYDFFFKKEFLSSNGQDFFQVIKTGISNNGLQLNKEDTNLILKYNDITIRGIRELIVEMVRLQKYPSYPSRLNCLYVSETYEDISKWIKIFETYKRNILQIVKLKSNGNYFSGNGELLPKEDATSFEKKINQANEYWKNEGNTTLPEVLLDGEIEVVEIVNEF